MIQPVASGRLFHSDRSIPLDDADQRERELITRIEQRRQRVVDLNTTIRRLRDEARRFGGSSTDLDELQRRLREARGGYRAALSELNDFRQTKTDAQSNRRTVDIQSASAGIYNELRTFEREFPNDAKYLKTHQYYTSSGALASFSVPIIDGLGSIVDSRV